MRTREMVVPTCQSIDFFHQFPLYDIKRVLDIREYPYWYKVVKAYCNSSGFVLLMKWSPLSTNQKQSKANLVHLNFLFLHSTDTHSLQSFIISSSTSYLVKWWVEYWVWVSWESNIKRHWGYSVNIGNNCAHRIQLVSHCFRYWPCKEFQWTLPKFTLVIKQSCVDPCHRNCFLKKIKAFT